MAVVVLLEVGDELVARGMADLNPEILEAACRDIRARVPLPPRYRTLYKAFVFQRQVLAPRRMVVSTTVERERRHIRPVAYDDPFRGSSARRQNADAYRRRDFHT